MGTLELLIFCSCVLFVQFVGSRQIFYSFFVSITLIFVECVSYFIKVKYYLCPPFINTLL